MTGTIENLVAAQVGDELPPLVLPALTRTACALFAGASGDHNPIHIDIDAARAAGLDDVIGHGMFSMAQLGRLLINWAPQSTLRKFHVRFAEPTQIGDQVTCSGRVTARETGASGTTISVEIQASDASGRTKTAGEAVFLLP